MAIEEITVDELADHLANGATVIDVRNPDEYEQAHVPGAKLVPLPIVDDHIDEFRGEGTVYVICRSGARSMRACEIVADEGCSVANVIGGTMAWVDAGHPTNNGTA